MRRIFATILWSIFRFLKIISDSDKRVSLCELVAKEATKRHIFHQNDWWFCLQLVWKAMLKTHWMTTAGLSTQKWGPPAMSVTKHSVAKKLAYHIKVTHAERKKFSLWHQIWRDSMHLLFRNKKQFEGSQEKSAWENYWCHSSKTCVWFVQLENQHQVWVEQTNDKRENTFLSLYFCATNSISLGSVI